MLSLARNEGCELRRKFANGHLTTFLSRRLGGSRRDNAPNTLHLDKLLHGLEGEKDKYYALYALTQCLSSATMWAEPYLCDSLLVKYGGHVVFDYSIPLAFIVYLAAAARMEPRKAKAA